jgi:chemotaxis protein MotB
MAKKRIQKGSPKWMATFADMMTLVLVFFIMLFSLSQIDAIKFKKLKESFDQKAITEGIVQMESEVFDIASKGISMQEIEEFTNERVEQTETLDDLYERIVEFIMTNNLEEDLEAIREIEGVKIIITERILFETAQAEILPEAKKLIAELSVFFKQVYNEIQIEGHTDNRPINSFMYPSNWELSGARASSIIRYLINSHKLESSRFIAIGYGDTEPIAPNDGPDNWQKNRRVVIFIKEDI